MRVSVRLYRHGAMTDVVKEPQGGLSDNGRGILNQGEYT